MGSLPVLREYFLVGLMCTIVYFIWFVLLPLLNSFEFGIYLVYKPLTNDIFRFGLLNVLIELGSIFKLFWLYNVYYVFFPSLNKQEQIYWNYLFQCLKGLLFGSKTSFFPNPISFSIILFV